MDKKQCLECKTLVFWGLWELNNGMCLNCWKKSPEFEDSLCERGYFYDMDDKGQIINVH